MKRFFLAAVIASVSFAAQAQDAGYDAMHACYAKEGQVRQDLEDAKKAYNEHRLSFWNLGEAMNRSIEAQRVETFDRCYKEEKRKRGLS